MEIVALQEIRWMGTGTLKMNDGNIFYGDCGNTHELGTGFYVNNSVLNSVKDFQSINNRIFSLTIEAQWFDRKFINVHAPTEDKDDETKEDLYRELERECIQQPASE